VVFGFLAFVHSVVSKIEYVHIEGFDECIDGLPVAEPIGSTFIIDPNSIITCNAVGLILQRQFCTLANSVITAFETYLATPQNERNVHISRRGDGADIVANTAWKLFGLIQLDIVANN
jgi:hypothetical protein